MILIDYWWIGLVLIAIVLGLLAVKVVYLMVTNRGLEDENETLKWRLHETELNLSIVSGWNSSEDIEKADDSLGNQTERGTGHAPSEDTIISTETGVEEGAELTDSQSSFPALKRKVRIRKILGASGKIRLGASYEGLEEMPPQVGKSYRVFTAFDKALVTSPVVRVEPGYIETANSFYKIEVLENDLRRVDFETIWESIKKHQGQVFETKTGIQFTYRIENNILRTDRTNQDLSRSNFAKAYRLMPISSPGSIKEKIRGPAYVWSILNDRRISQLR